MLGVLIYVVKINPISTEEGLGGWGAERMNVTTGVYFCQEL